MSEVEIWRVGLSQPPARVDELAQLLDAAERERAARMAAAAEWIVSRAALRIVLAGKLGMPPQELSFLENGHGKPSLPDTPLHFNLSHARGRACVAVSERREVGIDIERTERRSHAVERALTAGERAALQDAPDRHMALLQVWCRKEALAKARGVGLGWAPEAFDTTAPGAYALADLALDGPYVGALAIAGDRVPAIVQRIVNLAR